MRVDMCSTSGQLVSTASSTPATITQRISFALRRGEGAQRERGPEPSASGPSGAADCPSGRGSRPSADDAAPGTAEDSAGVREGLGTPVLIDCSCSRQQGSAQHTGGAFRTATV